ncbi:hypothetical protein TBLA_0A02240 [Henningerozyma blattae CBS 6284]|uniref:non-specific serine/threonine protein kinase n=1 Tax=Henningerozyma blattae (strain ATCC 34711 / CBS 6284 / DSM 70876 / NBRC 10599 / NRRL Y-10934 / UCD 77-7) TaxID=1071380 RepID=I2GV72_HENB6|nr:hypothetical protein TBLA_0A02240 [Tetrapisispora blattae CBS 6284]CCH58024.1 hypothetical protein TBLA_0A02240 [Tetrapisispora blattae CBS 6284]
METLINLSNLLCCGCLEIYYKSYVHLNGKRYEIVKLLGEGSYSFVYLAQILEHMSSRRFSITTQVSFFDSVVHSYALKKVVCPAENLTLAYKYLQEIHNYKRFQCGYIVPCLDSQVIQEKNGNKTIWMVFPYYPLGSLQQVVDRHMLEGTFISESEAIRIMIGILKGVLRLHSPMSPIPNINTNGNTHNYIINSSDSQSNNGDITNDTTMDSTLLGDQDLLLFPEIGESTLLLESSLMELDTMLSDTPPTPVDPKTPYAHRDLTPSNILFASDGYPILSDLGSCIPANVSITTNSQLIKWKDWIAESCTLPYTAPEILNIRLNSHITTKSDIWSVGCIFYCILFGISPFEREEQLRGASITYALSTGHYSFPSQNRYSNDLLNVIKACLQIDPTARPSADTLFQQLETLSHTS